MIILPDTFDLIWMFERAEHTERVRNFLTESGSHLALSSGSVFEFCRPLVEDRGGGALERISRQLDELDTFPRYFFPDGIILRDELDAAARAWRSHTEPVPLEPLVDRFDKALVGYSGSLERYCMNFSLRECVLKKFAGNPAVFRKATFEAKHRKVQAAFQCSRELGQTAVEPSPELFVEAIRNHLEFAQIELIDFVGFAGWLWGDPNRAPSVRARFELSCELARNTDDRPKAGDAFDFGVFAAIPYVDSITLDKRILHYAKAALKRLARSGLDLSGRIGPKLDGIVSGRLRARDEPHCPVRL